MTIDRYRFEDEDRAMGEELTRNELPWDADELRELERECAELEAAYAAEAENEALTIAHVTDVATGEALAMLIDLHGGEDCDGEVPAPVEVLEVQDTNGQSHIRARVRCTDGTVRVARASIQHYPGNRECPPEYDVEYSYE